jgi:mannose-6-phosphate isomerase-like protein (cupin superfamily)
LGRPLEHRTGEEKGARYVAVVGHAVRWGSIREALMPKAKAKSVTKPAARSVPRTRPTKRRSSPAAKAKAKRRPKHSFAASHHREEDFKIGLRNYAKYRDLGMSQATNGMVQAYVIRFVPPCRPEEVSKLHFHEVDFQMVYVLKGWIKTELEDQGAIVMRQGSCWIQPSRIEHKVLDFSDDCEVLEIVLPADFKTVELE